MVDRIKTPLEKYGYYHPKVMSIPPKPGSYLDSIPDIKDFPASFRAIRTSGDCLRAKIEDRIPSRDYTYYNIEAFIHGKQNHFQGVQRTYCKSYVILSGGHKRKHNAHLFIAKMDRLSVDKPWRYDLHEKHIPLALDRIVTVIKVNNTTKPKTNEASKFNLKHGIDKDMWHAGSISLYGDILAVPLEGEEDNHLSRVVFYSVSDPEKPALFNHLIERDSENGGAVALTKLPNGRFLLAVLYAPDKDKMDEKDRANKKDQDPRYIDFYISISKDFADGFDPMPFQWKGGNLAGNLKNFENYQGIELLHDLNNRLYLVGTFNSSKTAPVFNGKDIAHLYEITFKNVNALNVTKPLSANAVTLRRVDCKRFYCNKDDSNMRAGTGIHVLPGGNPILYCCNHFVKNLMRRDAQIGYLRFDEYSVQAGFGNDDIITDIADGWIDLFDHDDFSGARITILGEKLEDSKFENYKKIYARDESFGDRISSLRFQLPDGVEYLLYEHHSFGGKRIPLEGTGKVEESRHIRFGVSSSQFL